MSSEFPLEGKLKGGCEYRILASHPYQKPAYIGEILLDGRWISSCWSATGICQTHSSNFDIVPDPEGGEILSVHAKGSRHKVYCVNKWIEHDGSVSWTLGLVTSTLGIYGRVLVDTDKVLVLGIKLTIDGKPRYRISYFTNVNLIVEPTEPNEPVAIASELMEYA